MVTYGAGANNTKAYLDGSTTPFFTTTVEMPTPSAGQLYIAGGNVGNITAGFAFVGVYDHNLTVTPTTGEWPLLYAWLKNTELATNHPEVTLP